MRKLLMLVALAGPPLMSGCIAPVHGYYGVDYYGPGYYHGYYEHDHFWHHRTTIEVRPAPLPRPPSLPRPPMPPRPWRP